MNYKALIQKNKAVILPDQIPEILKVAPGDQIDFVYSKKEGIQIKKAQNFSEFLNELHQEMQADNYLEKVELSTEEDIAEYIRQIRREKSNS